ncbi:hypothetical protein D5018_05815 [Parashewanella curva]|uniref:Uncharacterized protein n=1 Tax=Parashewanella curva TaxID=2338552 RepID=A0A3L8PYT0_9GAMM|nr:ankyrin repeat domain-containing protein [Parashewanella curva]RLV60616.1 hypothetical protein D5018_05815 [Parashewanella curva]
MAIYVDHTGQSVDENQVPNLLNAKQVTRVARQAGQELLIVTRSDEHNRELSLFYVCQTPRNFEIQPIRFGFFQRYITNPSDIQLREQAYKDLIEQCPLEHSPRLCKLYTIRHFPNQLILSLPNGTSIAMAFEFLNRVRIPNFSRFIEMFENMNHDGIQEMLERPINIDAPMKNGDTLLMVAAGYYDATMVNALLNASANPNKKNERGKTALSYAAKCGQVASLELLLAKKADSLITDKCGRLPLHFAARNGHVECMKKLLASDHSTINQTDSFGYTPLHCAVREGRKEIVEELCATVEMRFNTPAFIKFALSAGQTGIAKLLKSYTNTDIGSDITISSLLREESSEDTLTHQIWSAIEHADELELNALLSSGNLPKSLNLGKLVDRSDGFFLLHKAAAYANAECCQRLLRYITDKNLRLPDTGFTPLHIAAIFDNQGALECLGRSIPRIVNMQCSVGATAASYAAMRGSEQGLRWLVKRGNANLLISSDTGKTPLHVAAYHGHIKCVKFILNQDVPYKTKDNQGATPIRLATENGHWEVVKYIEDFDRVPS